MSLKSCINKNKYNYNYFHQGNVCRLCWSATKSNKPIENDSHNAKKVLEYIGINVTTGIPNKVCTICLNKINSFISFKKACQESESKLKIILSKTFEDNYDNPTILKKEADFELKILADEVNKEKLDRLIIKQEKDSNFEIEDHSDYDGLLPKDDNYCYICSLNFNSTEQMTKHKIDCHMRACEKSERRNKLIHQCKKCSTIFMTAAILRKHMHTHQREKKDENTKEIFVCEVCGQIYSKSNKYLHMLIHTNYKQLKCPHCDYRATLQASLNTHMKLHTGERPFACDQCPYRCITSSNLNKHRKTHTDVKEYTCHICNKGYRYNASLRDHITSAHQGERKHKCKKCGAQYFHFKGLRKHMLVKHKQRVRKVKDDFVEVDEESYTRTSSKDKVESGMGHEEARIGQEDVGFGHGDAEISHEQPGRAREARISHEEAEFGHGEAIENIENDFEGSL